MEQSSRPEGRRVPGPSQPSKLLAGPGTQTVGLCSDLVLSSDLGLAESRSISNSPRSGITWADSTGGGRLSGGWLGQGSGGRAPGAADVIVGLQTIEGLQQLQTRDVRGVGGRGWGGMEREAGQTIEGLQATGGGLQQQTQELLIFAHAGGKREGGWVDEVMGGTNGSGGSQRGGGLEGEGVGSLRGWVAAGREAGQEQQEGGGAGVGRGSCDGGCETKNNNGHTNGGYCGVGIQGGSGGCCSVGIQGGGGGGCNGGVQGRVESMLGALLADVRHTQVHASLSLPSPPSTLSLSLLAVVRHAQVHARSRAKMSKGIRAKCKRTERTCAHVRSVLFGFMPRPRARPLTRVWLRVQVLGRGV